MPAPADPAETPDRHDSADSPSRAFAITLAVLVLIGLAIRVAFVLIRQSKVQLTTGDAYWYHFQARLVADGKGFLNPFEYFKNGVEQPGADHPPGMVLILAAADLLGISTPQGQRLLMSVMGSATVAVVGLVGRRLVNWRVGLVAAALAAIYPNIWINDGMLMAETPFLLAVALSFLLAYRYLDGGSRWSLVGLSGALTAAAMTRPESIVLFVVMLVPLVVARRELAWKQRLAQVALAAAVPIVLFAPWVAYNMSRFAEPVVVSTGAGQTLAVGNCDLTYSGDFLGFYNVQCLFPPQIDPPTETDPSVRDPQYRAIARAYIAEHADELPKVLGARVGRMWQVYRVEQGIKLDGWIEGRSGGPPGSGLQPVRAALVGYYLLLPLAVGGALLLRRRRIPMYPLLSHVALATFVAASTFGVTRYRAGAELALVLLAAVAVDALLGSRWPLPVRVGLQRRDRPPETGPPAATPEAEG